MMDATLYIKIDSDLKERFRQAAAAQNPGIAPDRVMSIVIRELILKYVEEVERWEGSKTQKGL